MTFDAVLLALLLAELGWLFVRRAPSPPRERRFATWSGRAWLRYGVTSIAGLVLLGRLDALGAMPPEFDAMAMMTGSAAGDPWLMASYAGGMAIGMAVADAVAIWRRGRRRWLPDYSQLEALPGELRWATALALTAGMTEEPFFRLLLPLLVARVTGDAIVGFAAAAVLFGLAHRYQGWKGMALTTLSAVVLTVVYVQTGNLLFAAALHAAIDWNLIVLQPMLVRWFARR